MNKYFCIEKLYFDKDQYPSSDFDMTCKKMQYSLKSKHLFSASYITKLYSKVSKYVDLGLKTVCSEKHKTYIFFK